MLYNDFCKCINLCQEHINEGGGKITNIVLLTFNIPQNIKDLIKLNYKLVKKIVDFYYEDFTIKSNYYETLQEALNNIEFIKNKTNNKKSQVIEFNDEILPWLKSTQFFNNIYENCCPNIIDPTEIEPIKTINSFIPRDNQKEAFEVLEREGLTTGIHCQATGCGKSYIIIKYIDYICNNKINPKVILFTERVNILSDLFSFTCGKLEPDLDKLEYWKNLGVGDLTRYNIINRVTNKNKDWDKIMVNSTNPTLLVINRAFLTLGKKYKVFKNNDLDLVLHDECHNTTSNQCHEFLLQCKSLNIPIIGFSATPLRTGKYDKTRLLEIYSKEDSNELNLLTNYNMIYAINKKLILPPEFHWYQLESTKTHKLETTNVSQEELGSVFEILNNLVVTLPNKKIIAWCGTIVLAEFWKSEIEKSYRQRSNLNKFMFGLDTSKEVTEDYNYFSKVPKDKDGNILLLEDLPIKDKRRMYYGKSILFCANKHREGSDIKLLDACIFLDKVKDRGSIPFIQSIGRTLRLCPDTETKCKGVIIDGLIKEDNNYEKNFINKIIGYYLALENITNIDGEDKYEQYVKMKDVIKFDKEQQIINMNIGTNIIKIHCNKLEWNEIITKFDKVLQEKIKLTEEEVFYLYIEKLKELEEFQNPENNFWEEYKKLDHDKLNLPKDIYTEYENIWKTKTWYDLLDYKNIFYDFNTCQKVFRTNPKLFAYFENWYLLSNEKLKKIRKIDNKIPPYCREFYKFDINKII